MYLRINIHTYIHMYVTIKKKEATNLKESKGKGGTESGLERERGNDAIIF